MADVGELLERIHAADREAVEATGRALPAVASAAEAIAARLDAGGRWLNVGAGTSGRIAALDAAELPPTFGVDPGLVTTLMAGGAGAFFTAVEGAEDDEARGGEDLAAAGLTPRDAVVGVAASGSTPYVAGALRFAKGVGALTVALVCAAPSPLAELADLAIVAETGPEVLRGSTRMKAGTAQKLLLNMLSTAVMARRGLVWRDEMVAMRPTNRKLRLRAVRIVSDLASLAPEAAERILEEAGWDLPAALVSARWGLDVVRGRAWLASRGGNVARALDEEPRWG